MWLPTREDAETLLTTITKNPDWSYSVSVNGCGSGYGVEVRDGDGILLTEAYDGDENLQAIVKERAERIEQAKAQNK